MVYGGPLKSNPSGPSKTQAYRFPKNRFTAQEAKTWLKEHNISYVSFEEAEEQKKTQSFISLACKKIQALSNQEILNLIPTSKLNEIKQKDSHPFFQAYSIAHEGISSPRVLGDTRSKPIHWVRKAIQSIQNKILTGIKFLLGKHPKNDNNINGREIVGEVVADTQKEIAGKLHHVVVGYFPDKQKVEKMDICSQEAEWNLWDRANEYIARSLDKITGIVLSNSGQDTPAFSGARRLGLIQAFESVEPEQRPDYKEKNMDLTTVPFDELKQEIRRRQNHPRDIFTIEEIKADKDIQVLIAEKETLKKQIDEKDGKIKTLETTNKDLTRKSEIITAKDRITKIAKEMKLTEKQSKYVESGFKENLEDLTDDGLKKFVEEKIKEYKHNAEFFGMKDDIPNLSSNEEQTESEIDSEDYTKAENNPLLVENLEI